MGRIRPAWYYTRQATEAQRRQTYFQNRQAPTEDSTIESRGTTVDLYYRSLILLEGTDHVIYKVSVPQTTLNKLSATKAGLKAALGTTETALSLRGSGMKPTKIHWYKGATNPVRRTSDWGTRVSRYYDTTGGRSHYSIPFSKATGNFGADDLTQAFAALFTGTAASDRALLGAQNGRAHITWETVRVSAQT